MSTIIKNTVFALFVILVTHETVIMTTISLIVFLQEFTIIEVATSIDVVFETDVAIVVIAFSQVVLLKHFTLISVLADSLSVVFVAQNTITVIAALRYVFLEHIAVLEVAGAVEMVLHASEAVFVFASSCLVILTHPTNVIVAYLAVVEHQIR